MERNNWLADNTTSLPDSLKANFKPREINSYWDTTAQIGGPIKKDKLFFFTGFQYFNRQDRPAGFNGDFTSEKDPRVLGKLTFAASPNVRVEGFVEYDKYDIAGRGASTRRPTTNVTALEPSPEWAIAGLGAAGFRQLSMRQFRRDIDFVPLPTFDGN